VSEPLPLPTVSVAAVVPLLVTVPLPPSPLMASLLPARLRLAGLFRLSELLSAMALRLAEANSLKVPLARVMVPVPAFRGAGLGSRVVPTLARNWSALVAELFAVNVVALKVSGWLLLPMLPPAVTLRLVALRAVPLTVWLMPPALSSARVVTGEATLMGAVTV